MKIRIDKLLSNMGEGSRSDVKKLLKAGAVTVDGKVIKDSAAQVDEMQDICVHGRKIIYKQFVYIMLNKPQGVVSATEDKNDETVIDLLDKAFKAWDLFPVGRLDKDTEGLLLLTNDGELAHNLLSPKKHIPKTYYATIEGKVTINDLESFKLGVVLDDGYKTLPAELKILKSDTLSEIELTIMEGKFHQVKRMFEAVDKKVTYLKRISMGKLKLDETLVLGDYRELTDEEINILKNRE
jgi:16S rRNA pseudouridine516 synthase